MKGLGKRKAGGNAPVANQDVETRFHEVRESLTRLAAGPPRAQRPGGFTGSLAHELAAFNVRVKPVEPGHGPTTRFTSNVGSRMEGVFPETTCSRSTASGEKARTIDELARDLDVLILTTEGPMDLTVLPTFSRGDFFHVVVESPRGSQLKLKFDEALKAMSVSRPLPLGVSLPFDWGFIPSTQGEDGDPVDAMLLWDVASYPGVVVPCRALGVLQIEQNRKNHDRSERIRNDRVMALPIEARREQSFDGVDAFPPRIREELEQFAVAATALEGKDARVVGWGDVSTALALIRDRQHL